MSWARTVRFDRTIDDVTQRKMSASLPGGSSLQFGAPHAAGRTYGLVQGPASIEPAAVAQALPDARWYEETIIALAIEPTPVDALPAIAGAFSRDAGVAGVLDCAILAESVIIEFQPARTTPPLVLTIADVELRRFHGYRKVTLLNPLPAQTLAAIAAGGLQAAEIAPDRILESLLEQSGVE